jgi:hypothetical protein
MSDTIRIAAIRIAMWSGPRNISTAMMRSFENREDTAVSDEPFYAAYLAVSGADHPMRAESLASQPTDPRLVAEALEGPAPEGAPIWYQKHMTHHMLPGFPTDWMASCRNAFLIRDPDYVVASYAKTRPDVTLDDLGFSRQWDLFAREADRLGHAPPVIDAADVLADPRSALGALCAALGIPFSEKMLTWPAGPRASDGAWAPAWYASVEASTGFSPPSTARPPLPPNLGLLAQAGRHFYEKLRAHRVGV